jgi:hypothetical protein
MIGAAFRRTATAAPASKAMRAAAAPTAPSIGTRCPGRATVAARSLGRAGTGAGTGTGTGTSAGRCFTCALGAPARVAR